MFNYKLRWFRPEGWCNFNEPSRVCGAGRGKNLNMCVNWNATARALMRKKCSGLRVKGASDALDIELWLMPRCMHDGSSGVLCNLIVLPWMWISFVVNNFDWNNWLFCKIIGFSVKLLALQQNYWLHSEIVCLIVSGHIEATFKYIKRR